MRTGLPGLLEERMAALAIPNQVRLRALLAARGVKVSANTVSKWMTGGAVARKHLRVLLDILDVHGPDRDRAYRLAAEGEDEPAAVGA